MAAPPPLGPLTASAPSDEEVVRRVLAGARLEARRITPVHLRLELKKPVEGLLVVAARGA